MPETLERFRVGQGEVVLLPTIQGLVVEGARTTALLDELKPAVVALGVSAESVASLLRYEPVPDVDPFEELPDHDYVYSVVLRRFGEVDLPPADLVAAIRWAKAAGAELFGVDLSEEAYETIWTKEVGTFAFLRYGRIQRKLAKRPPKAGDARAFALAWDAAIRRVKGIARVEAAREEQMAAGAARLAADRAGRVVLVVDVVRAQGVSRHLSMARE